MEDMDLRNLIGRLIQIGTALSSERDLSRLLDMIVEQSRHFTNADGGTLFLVDEDRSLLHWSIIQNESMNIHIGGATHEAPDTSIFSPIPFITNGSPVLENVATYVANTGETVNILDVYDEYDEFDFAGPIRFDSQTGYRTKSMLVVPLTHFEGGVIGVLQLINARDDSGTLIEFESDYEQLVTSIASQAAVAVKNAKLFEELEEQFEAFIRTIAMAIDEKSAYTAGHVRRVVDVAMSIAKALHESQEGPFEKIRFTTEQFKALRIASWMHDVGKIATPEYVVDKATKLETIFDRVELVRTRYEVFKRDVELEKLRRLAEISPTDTARRLQIEDEAHLEIEQLEEELAFIVSCNRGGEYMADDKIRRIEEIATQTYEVEGVLHPRLTDDEVYNLCIRKGTLTLEEITVIRNHALVSYKMLSQLPFSRHLLDVPEIAAGHHEKLNGKGYPRGLGAEDLSTSARILAIADIFEALTAADRPYKRPTPLSGVYRILNAMVGDGELDGDLVRFAMERGVFDDYVEREVSQAQRDLVFQERIAQEDGG